LFTFYLGESGEKWRQQGRARRRQWSKKSTSHIMEGGGVKAPKSNREEKRANMKKELWSAVGDGGRVVKVEEVEVVEGVEGVEGVEEVAAGRDKEIREEPGLRRKRARRRMARSPVAPKCDGQTTGMISLPSLYSI
jgi:hypothetical protein